MEGASCAAAVRMHLHLSSLLSSAPLLSLAVGLPLGENRSEQ